MRDPATGAMVRAGDQKMVAATFRHDTSRNLDPQFHTRAVIANMVQGEDAKWRTTIDDGLFHSPIAIEAIYRAELVQGVGELGYSIEKSHSEGRFEIAGVLSEVIDAFSTRRAEIEAAMTERGLAGPDLFAGPGYVAGAAAVDGSIPFGCLLTSASTHDSQAAIPMVAQTGQRVTYLYELMDAACDAEQFQEYSDRMGHVAIIDTNPRRDATLKEALHREAKAQRAINYRDAEAVRYNERTTVERVNSRLKDDDGGRHVRVRGQA